MTDLYENILVPYNGTKESVKAFKKAVNIASVFSAKITILTCIERRSIFSLFKKQTKKEELDKEQEFVEREHKEMRKFASNKGVEVLSKIKRTDHVANEIIEFADENKIDLIILSRKKFSLSAEKIHYHSTVEGVLQNSRYSILIVN